MITRGLRIVTFRSKDKLVVDNFLASTKSSDFTPAQEGNDDSNRDKEIPHIVDMEINSSEDGVPNMVKIAVDISVLEKRGSDFPPAQKNSDICLMSDRIKKESVVVPGFVAPRMLDDTSKKNNVVANKVK